MGNLGKALAIDKRNILLRKLTPRRYSLGSAERWGRSRMLGAPRPVERAAASNLSLRCVDIFSTEPAAAGQSASRARRQAVRCLLLGKPRWGWGGGPRPERNSHTALHTHHRHLKKKNKKKQKSKKQHKLNIPFGLLQGEKRGWKKTFHFPKGQ